MSQQPLSTTDTAGRKVVAGDRIHFAYGIPPVGVDADVVEKGGRLVAISPPPHKPRESSLESLRRHVGEFWRLTAKGQVLP